MTRKFYSLLTILLLASGGFAGNPSAARANANHSVELSVSRLTCGSCVETIRENVSALNGIGRVATDLGKARSTVEFDPEQVDAERIAETITMAGYPATVLFVRDPTGTVIEGIDLDNFVARVGSRMVARSDYQQAFQKRMEAAELSGRSIPINIVCRQAWEDLLAQQLLLNAAASFEIKVDEAQLADRISATQESAASDPETLHRELLIEGYLDQQYPDGEPNRAELAKLLNGLSETTAVDIFEPSLKRYLSGSSAGGCGGSCCS